MIDGRDEDVVKEGPLRDSALEGPGVGVAEPVRSRTSGSIVPSRAANLRVN